MTKEYKLNYEYIIKTYNIEKNIDYINDKLSNIYINKTVKILEKMEYSNKNQLLYEYNILTEGLNNLDDRRYNMYEED
uniref:Uncharacterized protein n=1 Tax=Pithovirus LCDPAC02 TaxID=2506601 RepID=A0A481YNW6_9VIRU|nr:MAG: hypothetical protein LCDPAC02_01500 [Pithovirus LCDPAC02]